MLLRGAANASLPGIVLVGHSMGGHIGLHVLLQLKGSASQVVAVVTIATPLGGTVLPATPSTLQAYHTAQAVLQGRLVVGVCGMLYVMVAMCDDGHDVVQYHMLINQ